MLEVERKVTWRLTPIIMISVMFAFFDRIISSVATFPLQVDLTRHAKATLPKKNGPLRYRCLIYRATNMEDYSIE